MVLYSKTSFRNLDIMKIVVISNTIYPRNAPRAFRATELAKYFAKKRHEVYLFASLGNYDYSAFEKETGVKVRPLGKMFFSTLNSDSYSRNNFFDKVARHFLGRWLEFPDIEFAWKVKRIIGRLHDVDLLVTIAIPHPIHWGAAWAKKSNPASFPKVWVSDCGDPYMGNSVGKKPPVYFQKVEDFWGRLTDYITIPVEEGRAAYSEEVQSKIRIIPQGFDFSSVRIDSSFTKNIVPRFAFAGATYPGYRDPTSMLEFLTSLVNVPFTFVVYTRTPSLFLKFKGLLGDKLQINEYIPRDQLIFELSRMDFLINIRNNSTCQSPSKLIDYYLTKRPIIDVTTSFDEAPIFLDFLQGNYSNSHVPKDISQFDIENVGAKFLSLLSE